MIKTHAPHRGILYSASHELKARKNRLFRPLCLLQRQTGEPSLPGFKRAEAIPSSLLLAAFFSFGLHGLLASFLILSSPKTTVERMAAVDIIWERMDPPPQKQPQSREKPKKTFSIKEKRVAALNKAPSQAKKINYKPAIVRESSLHGHIKDSGKEKSPFCKKTSKLTENRKTYQPLPGYPWVCRKRRQEGKVFVDVKTNAEGRVLEVNLYKSSGYDRLDEVAIEAIRTWTFAEGNQQKVLILAFKLEG